MAAVIARAERDKARKFQWVVLQSIKEKHDELDELLGTYMCLRWKDMSRQAFASFYTQSAKKKKKKKLSHRKLSNNVRDEARRWE